VIDARTEAALVRLVQAEIRRAGHAADPGPFLDDVTAVMGLMSPTSAASLEGAALDVADTARQREPFVNLARFIRGGGHA